MLLFVLVIYELFGTILRLMSLPCVPNIIWSLISIAIHLMRFSMHTLDFSYQVAIFSSVGFCPKIRTQTLVIRLFT